MLNKHAILHKTFGSALFLKLWATNANTYAKIARSIFEFVARVLEQISRGSPPGTEEFYLTVIPLKFNVQF